MRNKKELTIKDISDSIDQLARITQKGFLDMEKIFQGADKKLVGLEQKLDKLKKNHEELFKKIDNKADKFALRELTHRVGDLELRASWGK